MWMEGPVPLGYDVRERKIVVNEREAEVVRFIFERHQVVATIPALVADLAARGVVSKRRSMRNGRQVGGEPYRAGALTHLLRNVLYTAQVSHHGKIYPGEHDAIVDLALWNASQALLDRGVPRPLTGHVALLGGMIKDSFGQAMASAHAIRGERRYLYYVSEADEGQLKEAWRLPAGDLDAMVSANILKLLRDPLRLATELGDTACHPQFTSGAAALAERLTKRADLRTALQQRDALVVIGRECIEVKLNPRALAGMIGADGARTAADQPSSCKSRQLSRGTGISCGWSTLHPTPIR